MFQAIGLFIRRRRHTILITLIAAFATLLLMAGSVMAWSFCALWRLGRIELTTDGAPLVCQVMAESSDAPIGGPFDLVARAVVALPAGDYRLLASGTGRLSRTYRFAVNRGETQAHRIAIDEGRLLGGERMTDIGNGKLPREIPIPFAFVTRTLERVPGKADFIEWSKESLICRDATTGKVLWNSANPEKFSAQDRDPALRMKNFFAAVRNKTLFEPAPDLDGDGTGDLLWAVRSASAFLALSGKNGSMLWSYVADLDGPGNSSQTKPTLRATWSIGKPALADVDRDGSPDLIVTCAFGETPEESARRSQAESAAIPAGTGTQLYRRVVMAISGRSGRPLWKYPIDQTFDISWLDDFRQSPALVHGRRLNLLSVVDGARWLGLDLATGQPKAGPFDLQSIAIRDVQYSDLDGDGEPELVALCPGPAGAQREIRAFSIKTGHTLWTDTAAFDYDQSENGVPHPSFPLLVDLDGDGRSEVVVPDSGPMPPLSGYRGLKLIDGASGKPRWRRAMSPASKAWDGVTEIIAASDLDGDGARDLVTISLFIRKNRAPRSRAQPDEAERIYVDALSRRRRRPENFGGGAPTCRPRHLLGSGNRCGGAAGLTAGRCSPSRSEEATRTASKATAGRHGFFRRPSICSRPLPEKNAIT